MQYPKPFATMKRATADALMLAIDECDADLSSIAVALARSPEWRAYAQTVVQQIESEPANPTATCSMALMMFAARCIALDRETLRRQSRPAAKGLDS